jgi:hypothetical protein
MSDKVRVEKSRLFKGPAMRREGRYAALARARRLQEATAIDRGKRGLWGWMEAESRSRVDLRD